MLTAKSLSQYSMERPPLNMLGRSPEVQAQYDNFVCKRENRSEFISSMKERLGCSDYYFTQNDFPYHTESGIEHWVCWYTKEASPFRIIDEIKKNNNVITFWKNHTQNMSIQEINHIHVFIQK